MKNYTFLLVCSLVAVAAIAAVPNFSFSSNNVAIGSDEIGRGLPAIYTWYNTAVTTMSGNYLLYAQTGWDGGGCNHSVDGSFDQVVAFKSSTPNGLFLPFAYPGSGNITAQHLRDSALTECVTYGTPYAWGIGNIAYNPTGKLTYITFDKGILTNGNPDFGKWWFELGILWNDGGGLLGGRQLLIDSQALGQTIIDPVIFRINGGTFGMFFNVQSHHHLAYATIDMSNPYTVGTVKVLNESGVLQTLPNKSLSFLPKRINQGVEWEIGSNDVKTINGERVLFYWRNQNQSGSGCSGLTGSTDIYYRTFTMNADVFGSFGTRQHVDSLVSSSPFPRSGSIGISFPAILTIGSTHHFYWTQDNECQNDFSRLDIMHAILND